MKQTALILQTKDGPIPIETCTGLPDLGTTVYLSSVTHPYRFRSAWVTYTDDDGGICIEYSNQSREVIEHYSELWVESQDYVILTSEQAASLYGKIQQSNDMLDSIKLEGRNNNLN